MIKSGFKVMVFYCAPIFTIVHSAVSPSLASIIVGAMILISCFVALAMMSQMGRMLILVTSM